MITHVANRRSAASHSSMTSARGRRTLGRVATRRRPADRGVKNDPNRNGSISSVVPQGLPSSSRMTASSLE
ncbi:hypothetical protein OSTOST_03255, partial [Ostertagia ostertagi]